MRWFVRRGVLLGVWCVSLTVLLVGGWGAPSAGSGSTSSPDAGALPVSVPVSGPSSGGHGAFGGQTLPAPVPSSQLFVTTSRYMAFLTGDGISDVDRARDLGCAHKGEVPGVVVLAFGRQLPGTAQAFRAKADAKPLSLVADVVVSYASALASCAGSGWTLAVTTSNYLLDDPSTAELLGRQWAGLVNSVADRVGRTAAGISVAAGIDLEPGWGSVDGGFAWLNGFAGVAGQPLFVVGSADGCPAVGSGRCANGWTSDDLARAVWGTVPGSLAFPQVFSYSGVMASQWASLAQVAASRGVEPRFGGVMVQQRACAQVRDPLCKKLDVGGVAAVEQLQSRLAAAPSTARVRVAGASNIGWDG